MIPVKYNIRNLVGRKASTGMTAFVIGLVVAVFLCVLALVQGVTSNYDTDLFAPIHARMRELLGHDPEGFEAERFVDCGDDVLVVAREEGRGSVSGAPVSSLIYQVVTVKDDKVSRFQEFYEEASALKAVGLTELPA